MELEIANKVMRSIVSSSGNDSSYELVYTRLYQKISGLAASSENCKWYSSLPLGAVVSLFCESV
jgi:hypothetical protein